METVRLSLRQVALLSILHALVVVSLVSCSLEDGESEASPDEQFMSAEEVCGGVLSPTAVRYLETATGGTEFYTSFLPGEPTDLESLLSILRETQEYEEQFCRIRTPESNPAMPAVQFYFRWEPAELVDGTENSTFREDPEAALYPLGVEAVALREGGAWLVFDCPLEGREGHLLSSRLHVYPGAEPNDRIGLLNALSRTVAEGFGCLEESELPEDAPPPLSR
ncbi:hypothetical protein [Streptomyces marincola]|uniref:hypothetical protein n=1 Tax=Streptomyces marincola TaxID=2878388 RepID=UPI00131E74C8|nr:hypothetical protein [Streptomyces marincola]